MAAQQDSGIYEEALRLAAKLSAWDLVRIAYINTDESAVVPSPLKMAGSCFVGTDVRAWTPALQENRSHVVVIVDKYDKPLSGMFPIVHQFYEVENLWVLVRASAVGAELPRLECGWLDWEPVGKPKVSGEWAVITMRTGELAGRRRARDESDDESESDQPPAKKAKADE